MKAKIGCYARVSTTQQDLQSQRHAIREWAKGQHIPTAELRWFEEKRSGKTMERSELQRLLKAVDSGKIDCVVVYDLSRFARNRDEGIKTLAELAKRCRVVSVSENIDFSNSTGMLIASILISVAQWSREQIVEKIKAGLQARRAAGMRLGRPRNLDKLNAIRRMYDAKGARETCSHFGFSRANLYRSLQKTEQDSAA